MLPVGFATVGAAVDALAVGAALVATAVPAPPPHAASAAADAPSPMTFRNLRRSYAVAETSSNLILPYLCAQPFASIDPPMLATWWTSR